MWKGLRVENIIFQEMVDITHIIATTNPFVLSLLN